MLQKVFRDADVNDDGNVDWKEFARMYGRIKRGEVKGMGKKRDIEFEGETLTLNLDEFTNK